MRKNYTNLARLISITCALVLATMALNAEAASPIVWGLVFVLVASTGYWVAKDDIA